MDADKADGDHEKIEHGPRERSKSEEATVFQVAEVALVLKAGENFKKLRSLFVLIIGKKMMIFSKKNIKISFF